MNDVTSIKKYPATIAMIAINVFMFVVVSYNSEQYNSLVLSTSNVFNNGAWYTIITSMFLHASIIHILCNMISLWYLGSVLEELFRTARFVVLYIASGIISSFTVLITSYAMGITAGTVGASGAIFGLFGALGVLMISRYIEAKKHNTVFDTSIIRSYLSILAVNVVISLLPGISWQAHIGGLIGGALITILMLASNKKKYR